MGGLVTFQRSLLIAIFIAFIHSSALADGLYVPPFAAVAKSGIPSQRAMIVYRQGIETLVVQSTYQATSSDVGWIVPVPSVPTNIDKAEESFLESLAWGVGPQVIADMHRAWTSVLTGLIILLVCMVDAIQNPKGAIIRSFIFVFIITLFLMSLLSASSHPGPAAINSIQSATVGSYDVQVIQAGDFNALQQWLADQKLANLNDADRLVFDGYIKDGWCFVVAHLRQEGAGSATPHPLALTFNSAQPVFPMRATALANSRTAVDLFVVADEEASANGFDRVVVDRFSPESENRYQTKGWRRNAGYFSHSTQMSAGHPDVQNYLWSECVVTRLAATLSPEQMKADVAIKLSPFTHSYRQEVYAPRARFDLTLTMLLAGVFLIALVRTLIAWNQRQPTRDYYRARNILGSLTLVAAVAVYIFWPVVPIVQSGQSAIQIMRSQSDQMQRIAVAIHDHRLTASIANSPANILQFMGSKDLQLNQLTGNPMVMRRMPGDYMVEPFQDGAFVSLYDAFGRENSIYVGPVNQQ